MKKFMTVSLVFAMLLSVTACENGEEKTVAETTVAITEEVTTEETTAATTTTAAETTTEETTTEETTTVPEPTTTVPEVTTTAPETTTAETTTAKKTGARKERIDGENGIYYIREFDDKDREISLHAYYIKDDSLKSYYTKKYDSKGGYEMRVYDGQNTLINHEFYNEKGHLVRINLIGTDNYILYETSDDGFLLEEEFFFGNGRSGGHWVYKPNKAEKTVYAEYYAEGGVYLYYFTGIINERNQYRLQKKYSADGTLLQDVTSGGILS